MVLLKFLQYLKEDSDYIGGIYVHHQGKTHLGSESPNITHQTLIDKHKLPDSGPSYDKIERGAYHIKGKTLHVKTHSNHEFVSNDVVKHIQHHHNVPKDYDIVDHSQDK